MSYSIDTSSLMDGWVRYYPPDVFPTVWQHMERLITSGQLVATDEVLRELEKKADALFDWADGHRQMFVPLDAPVMQQATEIINNFPSLVDPTKLRGTADPFVIALAVERRLTVVTAERSKPTKPKIPDVCQAIGVPCITLLDMFRREGLRF